MNYIIASSIPMFRRANLDGTNVETVINKHLATADGIAVDWIAKVNSPFYRYYFFPG